MQITVVRIGILHEELPSVSTLELKGACTLRGLIAQLDEGCGGGISRAMLDGGNVQDGVMIVINNRGLLSYPEGLDAPLKEGDRVTFTVMLHGG